MGGSQTQPDHPVLQSPSHLFPNLGLNYPCRAKVTAFLSHPHSLICNTTHSLRVVIQFREILSARPQRSVRRLEALRKAEFPFPDLTSATQSEAPFLPLSFKEQKLLNSPGLRVVKNFITSSLLSLLRMYFLANILATNHF